MMTSLAAEAVIDASVLLAFLKEEPANFPELKDILPYTLISSVNYCEVATVLRGLGMPSHTIKEVVDETLVEIIPFDRIQALKAADLRLFTKSKGLSLGDRACLALGCTYHLPVYTADRIWKELDIGVPIKIIR